MDLESLYKEVIMEHYQNPAGKEPLDEVSCTSHGYNSSCGDEYVVNLKVEDGKVVGIQVDGHGCAISGAAGSMLSQVAVGKPVEDVKQLILDYREMLKTGTPDESLPGDLPVLAGVSKFPVRVKCASLPMTTCSEALQKL